MIRNNTERSEGIKNGFIKKVGTSTTNIVNYANKLLSNIKFYKSMINKDNPFGDGKSSVRIYKIINNFLKQEKLISDKNRKQIENSYSTQKVASQFASIYKKQDIY